MPSRVSDSNRIGDRLPTISAGPLADLFTVRHVMLTQAVLIWILFMLFVLIKTRPFLSEPDA